MYTAPSWRGPYTDATVHGGSITGQDYPYDENEDPFLWQDRRGHYHALLHANTWVDSRGVVHSVALHAGRHAYSVNGVEWTYSRTPPYTGTIQWNNGSSCSLSRMERPYLLFDAKTGAPTHLINGVQRYSADEYTFTLVLWFNGY
jgi:hypothetical protein